MEFVASNSRRLGLIVDLTTTIISFYLAFFCATLVRGRVPFPYHGRAFFETLAVLLVSSSLAIFIFVEYPTRRLTTWFDDVWISLRANFALFAFSSLFSFALKFHHFGRIFAGFFFVINILLMISNRALIRVVLGVRRRAGWDEKTRLIVGCGSVALIYHDRVNQHPKLGIKILGYVADSPQTKVMPFLGELSDLRRILRDHQIDGVVVTLPLTDPRMESVINECELHGVPVELTLDNLSSKLVYSRVVTGLGAPRLTLSQASQEPFAVELKRVTDIVLSGAALLLLAPVFLAIAIAIKLDDGGPVFFAQTRVGQFGRTFKIHKFRSMGLDAENVRHQLLHLNEMSGPVFKISDDPRVTRVGRWLRKLSVDELPQFFDVFIGNMSLVGPRPPLPTEVELYDIQHVRRLSVKPGITCLWQISGRNSIDFEAWMDLDLAYIDNWSYAEDIKILLKTIPAVLKRRGAS